MSGACATGGSVDGAKAPRALLVSIRTRWAEAILGGYKSVELRRRFDADAVGARLIIYATLPTGAVIGHALVKRIERLPLQDLWTKHGARTSVTAGEFDRYFDGVSEGCAISLADPIRYETPIPLSQLKSRHGLNAPQSYIVLREGHRELIEHEQD